MKITVGSPNPASDCSIVSRPVAHSEMATPKATIPTGMRSQMKTATAAPRMRNMMVESLMPLRAAPWPATPAERGGPRSGCVAQDRCHRPAAGDVVPTHGQDTAAAEPHAARDLVDHAVGDGVVLVGERD